MNNQETEIHEYEEIFLSTKWAAFVEDEGKENSFHYNSMNRSLFL